MSDLETLADRLERAGHADDSIEAERVRRRVRERLLEETAPEPRIDRYIVTGRLGEGGMGVVYRARDHELGREVAIKLVRRSGEPGRAAIEQRRLLSEARALAQFSHPNVVKIFDVGIHRDAVYLAMELVSGVTLRGHCVRQRRSWREVVRVYAQAGEGLAAVHEAGLVHRDFKPDNVLLGDDGRVRVADFGLAREDDSFAEPTTPGDGDPLRSLTATGRVVGTPAYMAPEQYAGRSADARTDQFSFCVSLWEGLHGVRPFAPDDARAVVEGRVVPPPGRADVPEWVREVLLRGLAPEPAARWPTMRALLDALGRDPTRRRRSILAIGTLLVTAGGVFAAGELAAARAEAACHGRSRLLAEHWNEDVAASTIAAIAAREPTHSAATARLVEERLEGWAAEWTNAHEAACLANEVEGTLDDDARALRDACLGEHAERLGILVSLFGTADRDAVNHAIRATMQLPAVAECEDDRRLAHEDPASLAATHDIRMDIARATYLGILGRAEESRATAENARRDAIAAGDLALEAEAALAIGRARASKGEYSEARADLERAYFAAARAGVDRIALDAATQLVHVVGTRLGRFDEALEWTRHARGLLDREGESDGFRAGSLEEQIGNLQRARGDADAARAAYERALELWIEHTGEDSTYVAEALANLGEFLTERGELDAGERALMRAEHLFALAYGDESPDLAPIVSGLCTSAWERGDMETAMQRCERALELRRGALAPDHPSVALSLSKLATVMVGANRLDDARRLNEQAIAIRRARLGPTHPSVATSLSNLGIVLANLGDLEGARKAHTEALEIRRQVLPADHPSLALSLLELADVVRELGDEPRARAAATEALGIATAAEADELIARARELIASDPAPTERTDATFASP